jgi:hypothetical protein
MCEPVKVNNACASHRLVSANDGRTDKRVEAPEVEKNASAKEQPQHVSDHSPFSVRGSASLCGNKVTWRLNREEDD